MDTHAKMLWFFFFDHGYYVGARDWRRNKLYQGKYMVAEPLRDGEGSETDDAVGGALCVVGDNLSEIIDDVYDLVC